MPPVSFSAISPPDTELSPVRVTYKGIDLGGTLKGCKVQIKYEKAEIKMDQLGDKTAVDRRVSSLTLSVTTELTEVVNKNNWKVAFPNMNLIGAGAAGQFVSKIGESDLALAGALVLHPLSLPDSDKSRDYNFYLATASADSELNYGPNDQVTLKAVWNIYPDTSTVPARFMFYGDPSVGLVAATAAAAVFTGTGNGTITSEAVYNGLTLTETVTVKCIGSTTGNDFYVSGSISGALGEVHVAAAAASTATFTSSKISFVITQGATQFVYGDQFTIATTASNYS